MKKTTENALTDSVDEIECETGILISDHRERSNRMQKITATHNNVSMQMHSAGVEILSSTDHILVPFSNIRYIKFSK